jgi:hypothetical protein
LLLYHSKRLDVNNDFPDPAVPVMKIAYIKQF